MFKKLIPVFLALILLFNFNTTAFAAEESSSSWGITTGQTAETFLLAESNPVVDLFSPNDYNLDLLIGVILSVVPGFGVGHFWLGNTDAGWFYFKLDLIMFAAPLALALYSTIFSSLGLVTKPGDTMNAVNIFTIIGIAVWAAALGVKIWETASVWRFVNERRNNSKISISSDKIELTVLTF